MLLEPINLAPDAEVNASFDLLTNIGKIYGVSPKLIYGHNVSINNAALPEDIWEGPSPYPFLAVAAPLSIVSDSASDAAAGVGARTVRIDGLDALYNEISEVVTLNGVTSVVTTLSFLRVNYGTCVTGGSSMTNVGTITISSGASVLGVITPTHGGTHQAVYTVPNNKRLVITFFGASVTRAVASAAVIEFSLMVNRYQSSFWDNAFQVVLNTINSTQGEIKTNPYMAVIPEKSEVKISCTYADANAISALGTLQGYLVDNDVKD